MIKAIVTSTLFLIGSAAFACPTTSLKCTLQVTDAQGVVKTVAEASSVYTANPLQCMVRVSIQNPANPAVTYKAVASADGNIVLFLDVPGKKSTDAVFGDGNTVSVEYKLDDQVFSCGLK